MYTTLFNELDKMISATCNDILVQRSNLTLSCRELTALDWQPTERPTDAWLNDNVINSYMELINTRCKNDAAFPKVYAFNTYLAEKLMDDNYEYRNVRRWSSRAKIDLFSVKKIFIPINCAKHWTLIVIHNDEKKIELYDSLRGNKLDVELLYHVKDYLLNEHIDKKGIPMDEEEWRFEISTGPYQENGVDCGAFICAYADLTAARWAIFFKQKHIAMIRQKMLCELLSGRMQLKLRDDRVH